MKLWNLFQENYEYEDDFEPEDDEDENEDLIIADDTELESPSRSLSTRAVKLIDNKMSEILQSFGGTMEEQESQWDGTFLFCVHFYCVSFFKMKY